MVFFSKTMYLGIFFIVIGSMFDKLHAQYIPSYEPQIIEYKSLLVFARIIELISKRSLSSSERKEIVAFLKNEKEKKKTSPYFFGDNSREISFLSDHDIDGLVAIRQLLNDNQVKEYPEEINEVLKKCFDVQQEIHNIKSKSSYLNFFYELANCLHTAIEEVKKKKSSLKKEKNTSNHTSK